MQGGYHHVDDDYNRGPHRPAQFDTMNVGEPYRASPAHFDTMNLGPGPQRVAQFDSANQGAPVRVSDPPASAAHHVTAPPTASTYATTGETPMHPTSAAMPTQTPKHDNVLYGRIPKNLVIASVALRAAAALSLIVALAIIASDSITVDHTIITYADSSAMKYALAVSILGAIYSIYELVSIGVRLGMGYLLLPGKVSLFVSYIGDQVMMALLLTGGSVAAYTLKDLKDLLDCDNVEIFCDQAIDAGVGMIFMGSGFLAASLVISSYCFYKNKT